MKNTLKRKAIQKIYNKIDITIFIYSGVVWTEKERLKTAKLEFYRRTAGCTLFRYEQMKS